MQRGESGKFVPQPSEGSRVLRTDPVLGIKFVTVGGPGDPGGGAVRGGWP